MRYNPYVCHRCGCELGTEVNKELECIICSGHYCAGCFIDHMHEGHTLESPKQNMELF